MQNLAERARLFSLAAKSSGETRLATPVLHQASIEAGEAAAEQIARALSHDRARVPHRLLAIEIDAGQAFGTAHHASTRGCLIATTC